MNTFNANFLFYGCESVNIWCFCYIQLQITALVLKINILARANVAFQSNGHVMGMMTVVTVLMSWIPSAVSCLKSSFSTRM